MSNEIVKKLSNRSTIRILICPYKKQVDGIWQDDPNRTALAITVGSRYAKTLKIPIEDTGTLLEMIKEMHERIKTEAICV